MTHASHFRDLVSGRRWGLLPAAFRSLLWLAQVPYRAVVRWRNRRFDDQRRVRSVEVPVVSVGNITLGGTGKTPFVEWLARWFTDRGVRVALVSRGYGSRDGAANDEALELAQALPNVPHVQSPDRVQAARRAIAEQGARLIVLDDGFQHRRLGRDLDIVLIDALEPFGFGHVFPRGTLREPLSGLARAQVIALSRADLVSAGERARIRAVVERHAPGAAWLELATRPRCLRNHSGAEQDVTALAGEEVAAFCGVGNPAGFRQQLERAGYRLAAFRELADHQHYGPSEVDELARWLSDLDVGAVLCTRKDLVKLPYDWLGEVPLWSLNIELEVCAGYERLAELLQPLAERAGGIPG